MRKVRESFQWWQRAEELRQRELRLDETRKGLEQELASRLAQEQKRLQEEAEGKARALIALEVGDLREQLMEAATKAAQAQQTELEMRKDLDKRLKGKNKVPYIFFSSASQKNLQQLKDMLWEQLNS